MTTIENIILFDIGLRVAMPTIVIAALNGNANEQNHDEFLTITPYQSSWLGENTIFHCFHSFLFENYGIFCSKHHVPHNSNRLFAVRTSDR